MIKSTLFASLSLVLTSVAFAGVPSNLPMTLTCKADCSTERVADDVGAQDTGHCFATSAEQISPEEDGSIVGGEWSDNGGWDGDQYFAQFINAADLEALAAGKVASIKGTQYEGYSWDKTYISKYDINCTLKK